MQKMALRKQARYALRSPLMLMSIAKKRQGAS
jgi:hypothetical protein